MKRRSGGRLIARNAAINLFGAVVATGVALVAIPLLVSGLGTARWGVLSLVLTAIGYFGLFDLGLSRALTQLVASRLGDDSDSDLPALAWTAISLSMFLGVIGGVLLALSAPWLAERVLRMPADLVPDSLRAFYLLSLSLPFVIGANGLVGLLAAHQRFGLVNAVSVPMSILAMLGPLLVLPFSPTLTATVGVLAAVRGLAWFSYLLLCLRTFPDLRRFGWRCSLAAPLLRFGGWMTISNVISPLMVYLDRFVVGALLSMTAVAYYATPYEVVTRLWIIPTAVISALFPAFASSFVADRQLTSALFERGVRVLFLAVFPLALLVVVFAPEGLHLWLGEDFAQNSTVVLRWLAAAVFANCLGQVAFAAIQGTGRPDITAKLHVAELPLYILVLVWLLRAKGIEGVAIAWALRVGVDTAALFAIAARRLAIPFPVIVRWAGALTVALVLLAVPTMLPAFSARTLYVALTLAGFVAVGWRFLLNGSDRRMVAELFPRPVRHRQ